MPDRGQHSSPTRPQRARSRGSGLLGSIVRLVSEAWAAGDAAFKSSQPPKDGSESQCIHHWILCVRGVQSIDRNGGGERVSSRSFPDSQMNWCFRLVKIVSPFTVGALTLNDGRSPPARVCLTGGSPTDDSCMCFQAGSFSPASRTAGHLHISCFRQHAIKQQKWANSSHCKTI